jgi:hypothetical protein
VISGFNTDIEFQGTVFHVQTEDKGLSSRLIVSLVYNKGTILASKRVSYEDLAIDDFDEKTLSDRVGRQHKLICAAVRAGRLDELKEMTARAAAVGRKPAKSNGTITIEPLVTPNPMPAAVAEVAAPVPMPAVDLPFVPIPAPAAPTMLQPQTIEEVSGPFNAPVTVPYVEPVIEADIIDEVFLPDEAVAIVTELSGTERPKNTKLSLEIIGDTKFKGGEKRTVNVMICRGTDRKVVQGAQIMIKVLGSSFRPVIFHAASDVNGLAKVHLQMPHFNAGRAAVLIRALSGGEEVELRRIVSPG